MKLVVGLGNPGERYEATRHNVGFMVADSLHRRSDRARPFEPGFEARVARIELGGEEVALLKPQTFMNRSGRAVARAAASFGAGPEHLIVIHDDLDIDFGTVRVKVGGGSGGHRGLESCFEELGSRDFARVRVGIGRPGPEMDATHYVLEAFDETQRENLAEVVSLAADAARVTIESGATAAMNRFNRRRVDGGGEP